MTLEEWLWLSEWGQKQEGLSDADKADLYELIKDS